LTEIHVIDGAGVICIQGCPARGQVFKARVWNYAIVWDWLRIRGIVCEHWIYILVHFIACGTGRGFVIHELIILKFCTTNPRINLDRSDLCKISMIMVPGGGGFAARDH
jgi:hypothetical protein